MKITKAAALVCLLASMPAFGAIEAVLFHVTPIEPFTVPTGKVLLIENKIGGLFLQKGTSAFNPFSDPDSAAVLPLKIPEGWSLRAPDTWVFALLVDSSDLFASLKTDQTSTSGNHVFFGL